MGIKKNISIEEVLDLGIDNFTLIDVRSEGEYAIDHIPNAINIPILNDFERAEIGTIYKNEGSNKARLRGVDIVSPKLPDFIRAINDNYKLKKPLIIYCWRGGLRSEAAVSFARLAGITVSKLSGGYNAYRRYVNTYLNEIDEDIKFIVLFGLTCSGKTAILNRLKTLGYPVLNLEKYARHKGSTFGHIGENEYKIITQKRFESELFYDIFYANSKIYFTEGESKKIGKVAIPEPIFKKIKNGYKVLIDADIEFRVEFAIETYKPEMFEKDIFEGIANIKRYIDSKTYNYLVDKLKNKDFREFTKTIMENYYDPLYKKGMNEKFDYKIKVKSIDDATKELIKIFNNINSYTFPV
jgi:tRNA 2-selenouridine synthase